MQVTHDIFCGSVAVMTTSSAPPLREERRTTSTFTFSFCPFNAGLAANLVIPPTGADIAIAAIVLQICKSFM